VCRQLFLSWAAVTTLSTRISSDYARVCVLSYRWLTKLHADVAGIEMRILGCVCRRQRMRPSLPAAPNVSCTAARTCSTPANSYIRYVVHVVTSFFAVTHAFKRKIYSLHNTVVEGANCLFYSLLNGNSSHV
jgi:hypothetical protein